MSSEFTDLSAIAVRIHRAGHRDRVLSFSSTFCCIAQSTPQRGNEKAKKRGVVSGRLRLLPIGDSPGSSYEPGSSNNLSSGLHKIKQITHKKELVDAVRRANAPIMLQRTESASTGSLRNIYENSLSSAAPETDSNVKDIELLEDGVHLNARKFNDIKLTVDRRQREINALLVRAHGAKRGCDVDLTGSCVSLLLGRTASAPTGKQ